MTTLSYALKNLHRSLNLGTMHFLDVINRLPLDFIVEAYEDLSEQAEDNEKGREYDHQDTQQEERAGTDRLSC
jgi:hypothetical protein